MDVRVVDTNGQPVAGITIELVDQAPGAFDDASLPVRRASDESGVVSTADLARQPLDFRVAHDGSPNGSQAPHWAVRFVHGHRIEDTEAGVDVLGHKSMAFDVSRDVICVVEETGTIEIHVEGAAPDDRFHGVFVDQRPEPESHRNITAAGSFTGSTGSIRVPSGRGTLYLAQHGFLGAPLLTAQGPLMVSVAPGQTTEVSARFLEGPTARLIAPFDTIPFENMQALAPDGKTVVADLPFKASPLEVPSRFAVTASGARTPSALPSVRYPKHLMKAVDVPLALPAIEDPNAQDVAKRYLERPPMELIFAIDPGAKKRLPEVSGGWVSEAEGGLGILSRAMFGAALDTGVSRPAPGELQISGAGEGAEWSAEVTVRGPGGEPLPFVEAFVSIRGSMLSRGITGPAGTLKISGLLCDSVAVGLVDNVADQVRLDRPSGEEAAASGTVTTGPRMTLQGIWKRSPENASVGDLMVLVPAGEEAMADRRQFMTHAAPIAFVDAGGRFDFGTVPAGLYTLRAGRANEAAVDLRPAEGAEGAANAGANASAALGLTGSGESFSADLRLR